jgi:MaoC like domain
MNTTPPAMNPSFALTVAHATSPGGADRSAMPNSAAPAPTQAAALTSAPAVPKVLNLPSVDTPWRYAWAYGRAALSSLLGGHRMHAAAAGAYTAPVHISARLQRRWRAVFDVPARAVASVPLMTNQSVGTLVYAQLFADLGLNLRHLLHLQHRSTHHAGVRACTRSQQQMLHCRVKRVLRLAEDRVLVEVCTEVHDADGERLSTIEDGFIVSQLPTDDLAGLPSDRSVLRDLLGLRRRLPRLSTTEGHALVAEMEVPGRMGLAYGRISGDMNPVHTCRLGAWLFGLKRPFLQGLGLRNLVVRHLAELGAPVDRLQLTFAAPALLGQHLLLVVDGGDVEVHDAQGRLVAFGSVGAAWRQADQGQKAA